MDTKTHRIEHTVLSDHAYSSPNTIEKTVIHAGISHRLYHTIISLAHAWEMYYGATTPEAKGKAISQISLLESERNRILGTMVN